MTEFLIAVCVVLVGIAATYKMVTLALRYQHQAWLHAVHVQDDGQRRFNDRALIDARTIQRLDTTNTELMRQVSEMNVLRLNFAVMQDQIMENIRRTIQKEMRPESETHIEVPLCAGNPSETARITREELRIIEPVSAGGNGH